MIIDGYRKLFPGPPQWDSGSGMAPRTDDSGYQRSAAPLALGNPNPCQSYSRCGFKVGRGGLGGGAAPGTALEPPGPECPRVSAGPCGSQDADPRRGGAGRARCPSPGRPAAVKQAGAGGRSLSESRAKLGLCVKLGAPAGLQSRCGSAQRGNRRLPGGAGLRTSAPGARRRSDGTDRGCGSGTGQTPRGDRSPTLALLQGAESGSRGPPPRNARHLLQTGGTLFPSSHPLSNPLATMPGSPCLDRA